MVPVGHSTKAPALSALGHLIRLLADENLDNDIVRGVLRRSPSADLLRVQDVGLRGKDDVAVLEWAAGEHRVVVTHDVATMIALAFHRIRAGLTMPGLIVVGRGVSTGQAVEDLLTVVTCGEADDLRDEILYLPL